VPFYVVAPFSSFDLRVKTANQIPIEQRKENEVKNILGKLIVAPKEVSSFNPAFDVTPHQLISAIVTDRGIIYPPYRLNIKRLLCR
jgi:methylthioribose-1-phosphate isomerase